MLRQETSQPSPPRPPGLLLKYEGTRYAGLPNYILGLVDLGGESEMLNAGRPGWIVVSAAVNPPDTSLDFARLAEKGLGVIVVLVNGRSPRGTLPDSTRYVQFAQQCAEVVAQSRGVRIWVIGNEPNAPHERPWYEGAPHTGEVITPEMYASCFIHVRRAIRGVQGHENDWVVPAAIAPFVAQTTYRSNPTGDWVRYFADTLFQITAQGGAVDAIALHTHTHGYDAAFVPSDAHASGKFSGRHWHFRAYRDMLAAVLPPMRSLPVLITAACPLQPGWTNANRGWMQAAVAEITAWNSNSSNQPIQALCFYRWQALPGDPPGWGISDKPLVLNDLRAALQTEARLRWPGVQTTPDYKAEWVAVARILQKQLAPGEAVTGTVAVRNVGSKAWLATGITPIRLGYRWFNQGIEMPPFAETNFPALTQTVMPGQTAIFENVTIRAPQTQGEFVVRFDLLLDDGVWLASPDSPPHDLRVTVQAPPYAVQWEQTIEIPKAGLVNDSFVSGTVRVKNNGSLTWHKEGPKAVRLGYKWFDENGMPITVSAYAGHFEMDADTPHAGVATFNNVVLRAPRQDGRFTLRWDLIQDGVGWFSQQGVPTHGETVNVYTPVPDYAVKWLNLILDVRESLEPNESVTGTITVQNAGAQTWTADGPNPIRLTYRWHDAEGNPLAVFSDSDSFALPADVPPKGEVTFNDISIRAPVEQGRHVLTFDLVRYGHEAFSELGAKPFHTQLVVKSNAAPFAARWAELPTFNKNTIISDQVASGTVTVRNVGSALWHNTGDNQVRLGYRWLDVVGNELAAPGYSGHLVLPRVVPPRDQVTVDVEIHPPVIPGEYTLRFDLLHGEEWFADGGSEPGTLNVRVKAPPLDWGAEFVSHNTPAHLVAGQTVDVALRIANTGKQTWTSTGDHPVHLAYQWISASGAQQFDVPELRTALPQDVLPEENIDFAGTLATPNTPGLYQLHWDLVAEGLSWFADGGSSALVLPIVVTAEPTLTTGWRAEASHNAASAILAIDGDLGSFWSSRAYQTAGMWFRLSLDAPQLIDGIIVRSPGDGYASAYMVRISDDGQAWKPVFGVAQGNTHDIVATFAPITARYIQIDLLATAPQEWKISQVQIHPAVEWHATASNNSDLASLAIDHDPDTAWSTVEPQAPNMWFQLDLGRIENVSGLYLAPLQDLVPLGWRVSVWNQAAGGWQKVAEKQNNNEPVNITFAPIPTQFINIQLLQDHPLPFAISQVHVSKVNTDWIGPIRLA